MECPQCGNKIKAGEALCPFCGQEFCGDCLAPLDPNATFCARCGALYGFYCTDCDAEIPPNALVCPHCGASFEKDADDASPSPPLSIPEGSKAELPFTGKCPQCGIPMYIEDGFCNECGQTVCPSCGYAIEEDAEQCPICKTSLYFDCPFCGQKLLASTPICPGCDAFFPRYCPSCAHTILGIAKSCPICTQNLIVRKRPAGHRVAFSHLIACPVCGAHFEPSQSPCPSCGIQICPVCLRQLFPEDKICPACGNALARHKYVRCTGCGSLLEIGTMQCPTCEQDLCTECGAPVEPNSSICPSCGTEFESFCPECHTVLSIDAKKCPTCGLDFED